MFRPSESIKSEIDDLNNKNRELTRLIKYGEEEVATRRKLYFDNKRKLENLFDDKARSERMEGWLTKPKVVWLSHLWTGMEEKDYRIVSASGKQIRVGDLLSGLITLYKCDGHPVSRGPGRVIDIEKTFPDGIPK